MVIVLAAAATAALLFFVMPLIGTLVGILSGWVVGLFFEDTILGILQSGDRS